MDQCLSRNLLMRRKLRTEPIVNLKDTDSKHTSTAPHGNPLAEGSSHNIRSSIDACPSAQMCETCWKGLFTAHLGLMEQVWTVKPVSGGFSYTTSWANLGVRAAQGCRWCQLVVAVRDKDDDSDPNAPVRFVVGSQGCLRGSCTPKETQDLSVFVNDTLHFIGHVYATADNHAGQYIHARNRILDVGSACTFALAKRQLEDCLQGHERCIPPPNPGPLLPTRVIDCADPRHPRLVPTDGARGFYVALSYVWGEAQPHSTIESNLEAYKQAIDPSRLPQTILDAIHTTHALGLRYLWADTLCIIQDSAEDKLCEIMRMRHIYRDAYVTIIAASAQRVSEGFLQKRPAVPHNKHSTFGRDIVLPFICPEKGPDTSAQPEQRVGEAHVSPIWMYNDPPDQPLAQYDPTSEPVSTRGWCMQEYLMSPRALVFASHTLQFHCQTTIQNVGGSYHDIDSVRTGRPPDALFMPNAPPLEHGSKEWQDVREAWQTAVRNYTRRSVTVPKDKLVAIGGIAEEFQHVLDTDYLAGLWRDTLLGDLLWNKRTGSHIPRPAIYRAPSWSWAAVDGFVEAGAQDVQAREGQNIAEVVRCDVALQPANFPFNEVTSGTLVIRTPLIRCIWNVNDPNYLYRTEAHTLVPPNVDDDTEADLEQIAIGYLDSEDDAHIRGVWIAPLHWNRTIMAGMVVVKDNVATGCSFARYRRVGYFMTHATAGPQDWLEGLPLVQIEVV